MCSTCRKNSKQQKNDEEILRDVALEPITVTLRDDDSDWGDEEDI